MGDQAELRRRAATCAFLRYFVVGFAVVVALSACVAWALIDGRAQRQDAKQIRIDYCVEIEKLKTQNREDVADDKRNYQRNLRLLGIKGTPELRKAVEDGWAKRLERNAPKTCPYG